MVAIGIIVGLLVAFFFGQRKKLPLRSTLDALAPGLAAFLVFVGVAHYLSGEAFGAPTRLPWSIYIWNEYRHPAQIYETAAALGVLLVIVKQPWGSPGQGLNFLWFVALSSGSRLFLEAFRADSLIWPGGFRAAQVVALIVLLAALWGIHAWALSGVNTVDPTEEVGLT